MAGSLKRCNEISGCIKCGGVLELDENGLASE